jgi:serine/threonine protein kinase
MTDTQIITGSTGIKSWSAPETRSMTGYTERADVFSLGCLLQLLLTGAKPDSDKTPILLSQVDAKAQELVHKLLN